MKRPVTVVIDGYPLDLVTSNTPQCRWTFTFLDENPSIVRKEDFDDVIFLLEGAVIDMKKRRAILISEDNKLQKEIDNITNNGSEKKN